MKSAHLRLGTIAYCLIGVMPPQISTISVIRSRLSLVSTLFEPATNQGLFPSRSYCLYIRRPPEGNASSSPISDNRSVGTNAGDSSSGCYPRLKYLDAFGVQASSNPRWVPRTSSVTARKYLGGN